MAQKPGMGVQNSSGTRTPSEASCGGRMTWASTTFCVFGFSTRTLLPCTKGSRRMTKAPFSLTVCVMASMG